MIIGGMNIELLVVLGLAGCLLAAALTVPAGFGLATMTTPIFLLWFEPHHAIAGVAIVHGAHNAMKSRMLVHTLTAMPFAGSAGPSSLVR